MVAYCNRASKRALAHMSADMNAATPLLRASATASRSPTGYLNWTAVSAEHGLRYCGFQHQEQCQVQTAEIHRRRLRGIGGSCARAHTAAGSASGARSAAPTRPPQSRIVSPVAIVAQDASGSKTSTKPPPPHAPHGPA